MLNKSILSSLLAVVVSVSALPVVHAQDRDQGRGDYQHDDDRRGGDRHEDRHDDRRAPMAREDHHERERGAGPEHAYHRGDRLPPEYRGHQYVVDNWREHRLSAPPRGYHWVQTGGDYVLVAIGTGVILNLIFGN